MQNYVKILILSLLFFSFGSILFYSNVLVSPLSCDNDEYILDIPKNSSADFVSKKLEKNTCINSSLFKLGIYMTFNQKKIKPGLYSLKGLRNLGDLIKIASEKGRKQNKNIKLGICGEHGGDPKSIHFCSDVGLDYVSCSPYRVPVARLAAAQAQLKK